MFTQPIPARSIFIEKDGWAYYVANWQTRFVQPFCAVMVRLSPRHFVRYCQLKAKGRGEKTIAYLLFKKIPRALKKQAPKVQAVEISKPLVAEQQPFMVWVDIAILTSEQVLYLIQRTLSAPFPGLRALSLEELRNLYKKIISKK